MNKKIVLIIPLLLFLTACNTVQYSKQSAYTDPFWNNPRIVFRDVTIPPNYHHQAKNKKSPIHANKKATYHKNVQKLAVNNAPDTFTTKGEYGSSLNDSFNGVTQPLLIRVPVQQVQRTNQENSVPANVMPAYQVTNAKPFNSPKEPQVNRPLPPGTTYVPLTFPVPPPQSMMQQFHMKIGQNDLSDSNN